MRTKIAFVCNWGNSPAELLAFLARLTPGAQGVWEDLEGIDAPAAADYVVVLEDLPASMRRADLDLERTIFLPREPAAVRARKNFEAFGAPLAFTHADIHQAAVWRIMRPFESLASGEIAAKSRALSTVTSAASETPGHRLRARFLREFTRRHPGVLDVYGYGWKDQLGAAYKGELGDRFAKITDLPALCKAAGLADYRYSLAFENSRQHNYFTEKVLDCWLAGAMPIYWGCPNLAEHFPRHAFHEIDLSRADCVERVAQIVSRPVGEEQMAAIREARRRVLYRFNIWPTVKEIIGGRRPRRAAPASLLHRVMAFARGWR